MVDIDKFKQCFIEDEEEYFGRQLTYIEQFPNNFRERLGDPVSNVKAWSQAARNGIPDKQKRKFILTFFKIEPREA